MAGRLEEKDEGDEDRQGGRDRKQGRVGDRGQGRPKHNNINNSKLKHIFTNLLLF